MRAVRNIVDTGRTICCTIHQPSILLFEVSLCPCAYCTFPYFLLGLENLVSLTAPLFTLWRSASATGWSVCQISRFSFKKPCWVTVDRVTTYRVTACKVTLYRVTVESGDGWVVWGSGLGFGHLPKGNFAPVLWLWWRCCVLASKEVDFRNMQCSSCLSATIAFPHWLHVFFLRCTWAPTRPDSNVSF